MRLLLIQVIVCLLSFACAAPDKGKELPTDAVKCHGAQPLKGYFFGRGGTACPEKYWCHIHPADRFAVCCPK